MVNISSVAGRAARNGNGVYSLTKHGVGAFSESLRQEVAKRMCASHWSNRAPPGRSLPDKYLAI